MRRIEEKKRLGGTSSDEGKMYESDSQDGRPDNSFDDLGNGGETGDAEIDVVGEGCSNPDHSIDSDDSSGNKADKLKSPFSIDSLLQAPKVPRGRRPNSKYPRVQASKSMNPLSLGMMPLYPITQPVGFQVERIPTPPTPEMCPSPVAPEMTSPPMTSTPRAKSEHSFHPICIRKVDLNEEKDNARKDIPSSLSEETSSKHKIVESKVNNEVKDTRTE